MSDVDRSNRRQQPATRVDPITGAVIQGALENIAIEMGHKLMRMSYSSIIRESEDFGAALTDSHEPASGLTKVTDDKCPEPNEKHNRHDPGQEIGEPRAWDFAGIDDVVIIKLRREVVRNTRRNKLLQSVLFRVL